MSVSSIDQILQITATDSVGKSDARANRADGDLFRSHLERAADAAEPKPARSTETEDRAALEEEDEPLEAQSEQHEAPTTADEQAPQVTDNTEQPNESVEESAAAETSSDEVSISSEATQVATAIDDSALVAETTVTAETIGAESPPSQQQSSQDSSAGSFVETAEQAQTTTQDGNPATFSTALRTHTIDSHVATNEAEATAQQSEVTSSETSQPTAQQTPIERQAVRQAENQQQVGDEPQAAAQKSQLVTSHAVVTKDQTDDRKANEKSDRGSERFDGLAATTKVTTENASLSEAEFSQGVPSEASEAAATTSRTQFASENVTAVDRSIGSLAANRLTNQTSNLEQTSSTQETPTIDRARFVQRVSGAIRSAQQRDGQIQLRLSPPELGTLRIQLAVNEGGITAQLETESAAARNVLLDNLPALRERLAEQGMTIEKFDVDVGREGQQQAENRNAQQREANDNSPRTTRPSNRSDRPDNLDTQQTVTSAQHPTNDGLDVRI